MRRQIAATLIRLYPQGVGVLSWSCHLFAYVNPRGAIVEQVQPFKHFQMWEIANKPEAPQCQCANFFDPEVQGAWKERGGGLGHHPLCQYDRTAVKVFDKAATLALERIAKRPKHEHGRADAGVAQERPDEWLRLREEAQNR